MHKIWLHSKKDRGSLLGESLYLEIEYPHKLYGELINLSPPDEIDYPRK